METLQQLPVIVRCKVKHNPGNIGHLKQLCLSYFPSKGVTIFEEGGYIVIEV